MKGCVHLTALLRHEITTVQVCPFCEAGALRAALERAERVVEAARDMALHATIQRFERLRHELSLYDAARAK